MATGSTAPAVWNPLDATPITTGWVLDPVDAIFTTTGCVLSRFAEMPTTTGLAESLFDPAVAIPITAGGRLWAGALGSLEGLKALVCF